MARKRLVVEMGMGVDIRGSDYTKAAIRALRDALWHNSLTVVPALGYPVEQMEVDIEIGVAKPDLVDKKKVAEVLPYGKANVTVVKGGLDVREDERHTIVANAAAVVYLDIDTESVAGSPQGSGNHGA